MYHLVLHSKLRHVDIWKYLELIQRYATKHQEQLTGEQVGKWKRKEVQHYGHKNSFRGGANNRKNILGPMTLQSTQRNKLVTNKRRDIKIKCLKWIKKVPQG